MRYGPAQEGSHLGLLAVSLSLFPAFRALAARLLPRRGAMPAVIACRLCCQSFEPRGRASQIRCAGCTTREPGWPLGCCAQGARRAGGCFLRAAAASCTAPSRAGRGGGGAGGATTARRGASRPRTTGRPSAASAAARSGRRAAPSTTAPIRAGKNPARASMPACTSAASANPSATAPLWAEARDDRAILLPGPLLRLDRPDERGKEWRDISPSSLRGSIPAARTPLSPNGASQTMAE